MTAPEKIQYGKTVSWILYDFANTIYSMNVVSLYFATWITVDLGKAEIWYSVANSLSQIAVVISVPVLGLIADNRNRNGTYLRFMTLLCICATAALSGLPVLTGNMTVILFAALALFIIANYGFQAGLVFYNAFLPSLAPPKYTGKISGIGVAIGYVGSALGMMMVMPFVDGKLYSYDVPFIDGGGTSATFLPTAVLFFLFAIPALLFLRNTREPNVQTREKFEGLVSYYKRLFLYFKSRKEGKNVFRFLIAKFFFQEPLETIILFMAVYSQLVEGFSKAESAQYFIILIPAAVAGSVLCGWVVDRIGPFKTLNGVITGWILTLLFIVIFDGRGAFFAGGVFAGIFLGSAWTAARPMMISLVREENISEAFGLYALSGKMSAIIGPLIWGGVVIAFDSFGLKFQHKAAVISMVIMLVIGLVLLQRVPDMFKLRRRED